MPTSAKTKTATHTELGRVYVAQHRAETMFARERWYRYQAGLWQPISTMMVRRELWNLLEQYEAQDQVRPSAQILGSVLNYVSAALFVDDDRLDCFPNLVNMANGVYDLDDGNIAPHQPTYYMTSQLPFGYDPSANCPMWMLYLNSTLTLPNDKHHDPELAEFVQEAIGYSLTTDVSHHVTFWCQGEGANGKGVLFHVLEKLGGDSCVPLNLGLLRNDKYQLAMLEGRRIALCSEAGATDTLVDDATVKALISGDTQTVRMIRQEPRILHPTAKLWWSMNDLPPVADTSSGFWRRMRVIPFNRQFSDREQIKDLKERVEAELPGVFNWAMAGLRRLRNRGRFCEPKQVLALTEQYRRDSNHVRLFVEQYCKPDDTSTVRSGPLYDDYKTWTKRYGFGTKSASNLKSEIERLGYHYGNDTKYGGRHFKGLRMLTLLERDDS